MYDAKTREIYAALVKEATASLSAKLAVEIASVVVQHPEIKAQIQREEK